MWASCRNCKYYSLIRPFDKDDLRMLAKVAGFFSNQASQRVGPFELTPGQWQVNPLHKLISKIAPAFLAPAHLS